MAWVYKVSTSGFWEVGFYAPDGPWHHESHHITKEAAAERVHYLNGGTHHERTT
jgi:hypothetical protein